MERDREGAKPHVRLSADGVWECRLYLGTSMTGKPIRPYKRFPNAESEEEALAMAREWADGLTAGGVAKSALLPDLLDDYVAMRERNGASPNSVRAWRRYAGYARRYLPRPVRDIGVADMNEFEAALLAPKDKGGAGLSRNSVLCVHHFLRAAYNHFVDCGVCSANVMAYVAKPSPDRYEAPAINGWDFEPLRERLASDISAASEGAQGYAKAAFAFAAWLALVTGMRVGEVCAVRRIDVKRGMGCVHVGGTVVEPSHGRPFRQDRTKGRRPRNVTVTPGDMDAIGAFVRSQDAAIGRKAAYSPLVTLDGSYLRPTTVSRRFRAIADECGLPREVTFHSLRHTHASWLIAEGCDLKTLSERMGHADEATTLRIYGHLMPGRDALAAKLFAEAMRRASGDSWEGGDGYGQGDQGGA